MLSAASVSVVAIRIFGISGLIKTCKDATTDNRTERGGTNNLVSKWQR